jgi:hypothetical protein
MCNVSPAFQCSAIFSVAVASQMQKKKTACRHQHIWTFSVVVLLLCRITCTCSIAQTHYLVSSNFTGISLETLCSACDRAPSREARERRGGRGERDRECVCVKFGEESGDLENSMLRGAMAETSSVLRNDVHVSPVHGFKQLRRSWPGNI